MSLRRGGDGKTAASVLCAFFCLLSPRGHSCCAVGSPVETPTLQGTEAAPPGHSHRAPDPSDETAVLADPLTAALGETQIHRNCEIIHIYCLKLLNSRVICYVNIDN